MTDGLILPHGGKLIINMADEAERATLQKHARSLPQLTVASRQLADLEMLANGAYSPLSGFMTQADYLSVVNDMHLSNALVCSDYAGRLEGAGRDDCYRFTGSSDERAGNTSGGTDRRGEVRV